MTDNVLTTIAQAALAVARHVHDGGYEAVIVSGGSHQLSRSLLALGWGVLYPDEPILRTFVLDTRANELLYKQGDNKGVRELSVWFVANVPELETMKDARLCFVDDFAITGLKYTEVRKTLKQEHGFQNVHFALFAATKELELEHESDLFIGELSREAVRELLRLGQHIQGKEHPKEMLNEVRAKAKHLRAQALGELREVGRTMRR